MPGKVIPHRFYRTPTGARVSLHTGFVPPGSVIEQKGFTIEHPDGTTGLGRAPFATESEAQAWVDAHPHFPGMNQG